MKLYMTWLVLLGMLVSPHKAVAQPAAEQKRLDALVGKWRIEIDLKATPLSPATKASGTEDCQRFANLHVVCRAEAKGPAGSYSLMRTLSYVPAQKQFAAYTVDSLGSALLATGQFKGDTWTFTTNQPAFNIRLTVKTEPNGYVATAEYAGLDGKFQTLSEIKASRMK
jgi:hypothetical protein